MKRRKVLVLASGGLDSLLALKILERAGLDVAGIRFRTWFTVPRFERLEDFEPESELLGLPLETVEVSERFTATLLKPRHGYGKGANPCIDCKIFFLRTARERMREIGADFVATGEVIGQRPMTQNPNSMRLIERESGLEGYLLRPLSAKLLPPTAPEELGWVDRGMLLGISGRGRTEQMRLAAELGIARYPTPAGGCHLTEREFKLRLALLTEFKNSVTVTDLFILRYGRHFLVEGNQRLVVGRNERENAFLAGLGWGNLKIDGTRVPGPFALMEWNGGTQAMREALSIVTRFCDRPRNGGAVSLEVEYGGRRETHSLEKL